MRSLTRRLRAALTEWVAGRLKIPPLAVRMFGAANALSGLDRRTLPSELVPLNAIQLTRGLLNFTLLQSALDWVLPYWAERQYDPSCSSFVPRAHSGLSINMTHRNWTAVGTPDCDIEPVVDPRGLVMPFRDGWSIDTWLVVDDIAVFPSCLDSVDQALVKDVPVVKTTFMHGGIQVEVISHTTQKTLFLTATVTASQATASRCRLIFALRPFNPEGVGLVHRLRYDAGKQQLEVDGRHRIIFAQPPDVVHCSTYQDGDAALLVSALIPGNDSIEAHCTAGVANAVAVFDLPVCTLPQTRVCAVPLTDANVADFASASPERAVHSWQQLLARGAMLTTPDEQINSLFRSSAATLLSLADGDTITPGPFTYHHFWFRDAASMLWALDKLGYADVTRHVIEGYPERQDSSGYFRSQQGEWDSNGQALWTVWQHLLLTGDNTLPQELYVSLREAVEWIAIMRVRERKRRGSPQNGLLPRGLSAEHFGMADQYFWDNWWSCAGIEAYLSISARLGRRYEKATKFLSEYKGALDRAVESAVRQAGIHGIPAAPGRHIDCGMVGSVLPWYPLQYYPADDQRMRATLEELENAYVKDGMFFQHFVHSGLNPYLSMHVAHAWLYAGERQRFYKALRQVLAKASPTGTFPEAIHPATGGGSMGDGHHGWAAAEVVLALRDALVYEQRDGTLVLLGGIPAEWLAPGASLSLRNAPVAGGAMSIECAGEERQVALRIRYEEKNPTASGDIVVKIPVSSTEVQTCEGESLPFRSEKGETTVSISRANAEILFTRRRE